MDAKVEKNMVYHYVITIFFINNEKHSNCTLFVWYKQFSLCKFGFVQCILFIRITTIQFFSLFQQYVFNSTSNHSKPNLVHSRNGFKWIFAINLNNFLMLNFNKVFNDQVYIILYYSILYKFITTLYLIQCGRQSGKTLKILEKL